MDPVVPESRFEPDRASSAFGLATIRSIRRSPVTRCSFGYKTRSKIASRGVSTPQLPCFVCCNPSDFSWCSNCFVGTGNDACESVPVNETLSQWADRRSSGRLGDLSEWSARYSGPAEIQSGECVHPHIETNSRRYTFTVKKHYVETIGLVPLSTEFARFRAAKSVLFKTFIIQQPRRYTWIWQTNPTTTETS